MKRKTFRLRKWASWSLALACSFSNLPVLHGQSGQHKLPGSGGIPQGGYPALAQATTPVASPGQMQEDRLYLAWLSDPATFKLNLTVQGTNGGIRVSGCVPNDSVRKRVLDIAYKSSGGIVQDGLKTVPGMLTGFSENLSAQQLHERVQDMIRATVPACASRVEIQTDHLGRVTLSGQVNTLQDMLHVCQCLRQIPQCNSLVNRMSLGGFALPPQVATNKVTPPVLPKNFPAIPETKPLPNKIAPPSGVSLPRGSELPPPLPAQLAKVPPVSQVPVLPTNSVPSPTEESAAQNVAKTTWTTKTPWTPTPTTKSPQSQSGPLPEIPLPPEPGKLPVANKIIQFDLGQPYEAIALVTLSKADSPETVKSEMPAIKMKNWSDFQPVNYQNNTQAPVSKPLPGVPPLPTQSASESKIQSVPPLPPMPVAKLPEMPNLPIANEPTLPKKTGNPPVVPSLPKQRPSPEQVKWLVEKHCGSMARNVTVRYLENGKMEIRLQVQQEAHATAMFEQIVRIGELEPYQIKLKVEVAH